MERDQEAESFTVLGCDPCHLWSDILLSATGRMGNGIPELQTKAWYPPFTICRIRQI